MAAYRRVYDSRHLQADWTGISSGTLRFVIEYGLPLLFLQQTKGGAKQLHKKVL